MEKKQKIAVVVIGGSIIAVGGISIAYWLQSRKMIEQETLKEIPPIPQGIPPRGGFKEVPQEITPRGGFSPRFNVIEKKGVRGIGRMRLSGNKYGAKGRGTGRMRLSGNKYGDY